MPPSKKKPATQSGTKPPARKATPPKPAPPHDPARKATHRPPAATAPVFTPIEEQAFLVAIRKFPDDLTVHLAYADWLTEHNQEPRAAVLRAWVEFVRIPFRTDTAPDVLAAIHAYWASLQEKDARWLEAMERLRPWIPLRVAEKVVRVCLDDVYGPTRAERWTVDVTRCFFDDGWHGAYTGEAGENGKTTVRGGAFFISPLTGRPSGHITTG